MCRKWRSLVMKGRRLVLAKWVEEVRITGIVITSC
jgi:hypothetical protein